MKKSFPIICLLACAANQNEIQSANQSKVAEIRPLRNEIVPEAKQEIPSPILDGKQFLLSIDDSESLIQLEQDGYGLMGVLSDQKSPTIRNDQLFKTSARYRQFATTLSARIEANEKETKRPLVRELHQALKYPAGNVGRTFDVRWLTSNMAEFELVGVVNRLDRIDLLNSDHCGEIRLIYRLAYHDESKKTARYSRLPLTLNAVFESKKEDQCNRVARRWAMDSGVSKMELISNLLPSYTFSKIEVNAQISRYPSGLETEFAGQAVYLLQVYQPTENNIVPMALENTPDVGKLQKNPDLLEKLIKEINENIDAIDAGTHRISDAFLAKEALSYSTSGLNRLANKPYDVLLGNRIDQLITDASNDRFEIKSPESLIERLNNSTCMGCHQSQSTAGFHWLGRDRMHSGVTNRIAIPFSGHFLADQERRRQRIYAEANGLKPTQYRAHAARPAHLEKTGAKTGEACTPIQSLWAEGFGWGCKDSKDECRTLAADPLTKMSFGTCVRKQVEDIEPGMACREGEISSEFTKVASYPFNRHAYDDTFKQRRLYNMSEKKKFSEKDYNCRPTRIGVPLGRAYRKCTQKERLFEGIDTLSPPDAFCAIVGGSKFDQCVEKDFHSCLSGIVGRGMLDSCHANRFCREDYICQELPAALIGPEASSLKEAGIGFCTPTYFLFQMRLDGHPIPKE